MVEAVGVIAHKYLGNYAYKNIKTDKSFGIRIKDAAIVIGDTRILIMNNNVILEYGSRYTGTEDLWELLSLENRTNYFAEDMRVYQNILLRTHVYRKNNDPSNKCIKSNAGYKYNTIIKPILQKNNILKTVTNEAEDSELEKIYINTAVEYVYWNSLDELLE
ncbi:hypothetical protein PGB90_000497 [Kerria lacca]